jgi:hypothetical protein
MDFIGRFILEHGSGALLTAMVRLLARAKMVHQVPLGQESYTIVHQLTYTQLVAQTHATILVSFVAEYL